jgi:phage FluMu protein Com
MLFGLMRDFFEVEDMRSMRDELSRIKAANPNRKFVDQIGRYLAELESTPFGRSKFGKDTDFNMGPQLEKLEKTKHMGVQTCRMCSGELVSPRKTRCGHVFCRECLENMIQEAREQKYLKVYCPTCKKKQDLSGPKCIMIDFPVGAQAGPAQARRSNGNNARNNPNYSPDMPGNDANGFQPLGIEDGAGFLNESDTNIALNMAPSSKLARVKDIILDWQRKYPDDKIIG